MPMYEVVTFSRYLVLNCRCWIQVPCGDFGDYGSTIEPMVRKLLQAHQHPFQQLNYMQIAEQIARIIQGSLPMGFTISKVEVSHVDTHRAGLYYPDAS